MEPKNIVPNFQPESMSQPGISVEAPGVQYEQAIETAPERVSQTMPTVQQATQQTQAAVALPPLIVNNSATQATDDPTAGTMPLVAADDDLIEKEWVDKAKQIIQTTKDDPFRREQEISRLQADYVQKRYGRRIREVTE